MKAIVVVPLVIFCLFVPLGGNISEEESIEIDMREECQKYAFYESQGNSGMYERTYNQCMEDIKRYG